MFWISDDDDESGYFFLGGRGGGFIDIFGYRMLGLVFVDMSYGFSKKRVRE